MWRRRRNMFVASYLRGCLVFMVLSGILNGASCLEIKSGSVVAEKSYGSGRLHEKQLSSPQVSSRWSREDSVSENELDSHESLNRKKLHRSQLEYTCGRAVADKKYRDFFLNEAGYQVSRNKYRPTEIRMPRIIGGDDTTPGEFPWTVSVKLNGQPICGGSLIDKSWILTAAHCVVGYNPKNMTVRSGAYRIKDSSETQTVDSAVSMFIIHKEYSIPRPFSNDIALLKLTEPLEYSDFIVPVCLPKPESISAVADDVATNTITGDYPAVADTQRSSNETGGIVVSTKMSDVDIAQCFSSIEQNYLNSIGMGSTPEPSTVRPQPQPLMIVTPPSIILPNYLFVQQPPPNLNHLIDGLEKSHHRESQESQQVRLKPSSSQQYKMQQLLAQMIYQLNGNSNKQENYEWLLQSMRSSSSGSELREKNHRKETIKLSRLPISKELLHEIQSVGSGPMQTLILNQGYLTNGDFTNQQPIYTSPPAPEREKVSVYLNNQKILQAALVAQQQAPDDPSKYSIGLSGTVVGWGWVRETESGEDHSSNNNKGYSSTTLQKVKLPILHNSVCEAWFQSQSKKITLLPSQFCAGFSSGGKDACRGDSGGPMIIKDELDADRYTLIGIVSAGIGCARPSLPGLYTRVASFLPWIRAQMNRY